MKKRLKKAWEKIKAWFLAVLVGLGLVSAPLLAGQIGFTWQNASTRVDGTPFDPATEQAEIRIYCNGDTSPTFTSTGAAEALSAITVPGTYTCHATTVDTDGQESAPSASVTKTVLRALPNPPVLNED